MLLTIVSPVTCVFGESDLGTSCQKQYVCAYLDSSICFSASWNYVFQFSTEVKISMCQYWYFHSSFNKSAFFFSAPLLLGRLFWNVWCFKMQEIEYLPQHCEDCSRARQLIMSYNSRHSYVRVPWWSSLSLSCLLAISISFHCSYLSVLLPQENCVCSCNHIYLQFCTYLEECRF